MSVREYTNADEVIVLIASHLAGKLSALPTPPGAMRLTATELSTIWSEPIQSVRPPGSRPAHIAALRWVIRDDDLKILDTILDGLKASAGAGFFVLADLKPTAAVVAAAGLLAGLVKLAYNAVSKGVVLSPPDYSMLAVLSKHGDGLSEEQLLEKLLQTGSDWTPEKIAAGLVNLSEAASRSGKIALAWKSAGKWRLAGV